MRQTKRTRGFSLEKAAAALALAMLKEDISREASATRRSKVRVMTSQPASSLTLSTPFVHPRSVHLFLYIFPSFRPTVSCIQSIFLIFLILFSIHPLHALQFPRTTLAHEQPLHLQLTLRVS